MNGWNKVVSGFVRWAKRRKRRGGKFDQEDGGWPKGETFSRSAHPREVVEHN